MTELITFLLGLSFTYWALTELIDWYESVRDAAETSSKIRGFFMVATVVCFMSFMVYLIFTKELHIIIRCILIFISTLLFAKVGKKIYRTS